MAGNHDCNGVLVVGLPDCSIGSWPSNSLSYFSIASGSSIGYFTQCVPNASIELACRPRNLDRIFELASRAAKILLKLSCNIPEGLGVVRPSWIHKVVQLSTYKKRELAQAPICAGKEQITYWTIDNAVIQTRRPDGTLVCPLYAPQLSVLQERREIFG